jgi:hypothetical protein
MTLRDFAVCRSLRRFVIHRFLPLANFSEAARSELRAFSFCVRVKQSKIQGVTLERHDN